MANEMARQYQHYHKKQKEQKGTSSHETEKPNNQRKRRQRPKRTIAKSNDNKVNRESENVQVRFA
jgi:hypothetical protein